MQNDFEKNIVQRVQDFHIAPQPAIWQQVEAALPPEKKRRRIALWWWLVPLAILVGAGIWNTISKQAAKTPIVPAATTQDSSEKKGTVSSTPAVTPPDSAGKKASVSTIEKVSETTPDPQHTNATDRSGTVIKTTASLQNKQAITKKTALSNSTKRMGQPIRNDTDSDKYSFAPPVISQAGKKANNQPNASTNDKAETLLQNTTNSKLFTKADTTVEVAKADTTLILPKGEITAEQNTDTVAKKVDTTTAAKTIASKKIMPYKQRVIWMLEAGPGLGWQQFSAPSGGSYYNSPQYSTSPVTGQPVYSAPFQSPRSSASFSAGIARRQTLTPHWSWELALRYQLLTSVQRAGEPRPNSSTGIDRTSTYNTGDTLNYRNYIHQLQVAPRIVYTLNPAAHSPFSFFTGFSAGYVFASNQLLPDYRNYVYVKAPQSLVRWQYATEIGAALFVRRKINVGITYQYGLNNLVQPALFSSLRWRVLQMHLGLPLFNHPSK